MNKFIAALFVATCLAGFCTFSEGHNAYRRVEVHHAISNEIDVGDRTTDALKGEPVSNSIREHKDTKLIETIDGSRDATPAVVLDASPDTTSDAPFPYSIGDALPEATEDPGVDATLEVETLPQATPEEVHVVVNDYDNDDKDASGEEPSSAGTSTTNVPDQSKFIHPSKAPTSFFDYVLEGIYGFFSGIYHAFFG